MSETDLIEKFNLLDKVAKKSDRWWFFALLVIGMIAVGFLYTDMRRERTEQNRKIEEMHKTVETHLSSTVSTTTIALDRNTSAIEKNTATLQRVEERLIRQ